MKPIRLATSVAIAFAIFFGLGAGAVARAAVTVPPLQDRVTDRTATLSAEQQSALEQTLRGFAARTGSQLALLIVATTAPETIEQYSLRFAEQWKPGRKKVDDGAILVVAKDDRALRIEVGYGLEGALTDAIEQAIKASEASHNGEIRFAVEGALHSAPLFSGKSARARTIAVFSQLRVWDTEHNNGVLIHLLLADYAVEIVADRGIHSRVGATEWETICRKMETAFRQGNYEGGMLDSIHHVTQHLSRPFPEQRRGRNELPDKSVVL